MERYPVVASFEMVRTVTDMETTKNGLICSYRQHTGIEVFELLWCLRIELRGVVTLHVKKKKKKKKHQYYRKLVFNGYTHWWYYSRHYFIPLTASLCTHNLSLCPNSQTLIQVT